MTCGCGSFQCTCQGTCTCAANDRCCKRCNGISSDSPLKFSVSKEISPTRDATTLFTDLQVSDNQLTSVSSNNRDRKLLFEGWASDGKSLSNGFEQSEKETCKEFGNPSSPDLPKTRSPKPIFSTAKGKLSPLDTKRQSPCNNDQNEILPITVDRSACPLDMKASSNKISSECAKINQFYIEERDPAAQTNPCNPQYVCLRVSNNTQSTSCNKVSSKSKYPSVIHKNVELPTKPKSTCKFCATKGSIISGPGGSWGASASARPTSYMQSSDKGRTSNTSRQATSRRSSSICKTADPFATIGSLGITPCFVDTVDIYSFFRKSEDESNEKSIDDDESNFAPHDINPEAANSSTDSATNQEIQERNPLAQNSESKIFETNDSEISNNDTNTPDSPAVPDVD